jgi:acetyl esterase/lipase
MGGVIDRRAFLVAAAGSLAACGGSAPTERNPVVAETRYGDDPSQLAELHLPAGESAVPVVVVIHGGFWSSGYGKELASPLAADLARAGVAGYAIEYRRVGNGGGWPTTFADVAAAIDALAGRQPDRLDLSRVVAVGHSAGGQLAVWAAGRHRLPAGAVGSAPRVRLGAAISQAGVLDLATAWRQRIGGDAVTGLMGTTPEADPARFALGSPIEAVPVGVPVVLVHGRRDTVVPFDQSRRYADAARAAGDPVELVELADDGHFELIDPDDEAWATCRRKALALVSG